MNCKDNTKHLWIGRRKGQGLDFSGIIDQFRRYPQALSAEQVHMLYNESKEGLSTISTITSSETLKNQNWTCEIWPNDKWDFGSKQSAWRKISNSQPEITLKYPANNSNTEVNRTPTFNWTASDPDGDTMSFRIWVDDDSDFSSPVLYKANLSVQEYTNASRELDVDTIYYWIVEVSAGGDYVNSSRFNFTIPSVKSVDLIVSDVSFAGLQLRAMNDTTDNNPPPLIIRNTGNVFVNVTIKTSKLWLSQEAPLNTSYYQYKIDNRTGHEGAFKSTGTQTTWANMTDKDTKLLRNFNYDNSKFEAEIDLRLKVPEFEPSGERNSTITVTIT